MIISADNGVYLAVDPTTEYDCDSGMSGRLEQMYNRKVSVAGKDRVSWLSPSKLISQLLVDDLKETSRFARGELLDVGCGSKPYEDLFHRDVVKYVGLDRPGSGNDRSADVEGDALSMPFSSAAFDTVLMTQVLEHVPEPGRVVGETFRVLRPGGHLIVTVPQTSRLHGEPQDFFRFTRFGLVHLLERTGYEVLLTRPQGGFFLTIGYLSTFFMYENFFKGRNLLFKGAVQPLMTANQMIFYLLDRLYKWDKDTIGHLAVARKPDSGTPRSPQ